MDHNLWAGWITNSALFVFKGMSSQYSERITLFIHNSPATRQGGTLLSFGPMSWLWAYLSPLIETLRTVFAPPNHTQKNLTLTFVPGYVFDVLPLSY